MNTLRALLKNTPFVLLMIALGWALLFAWIIHNLGFEWHLSLIDSGVSNLLLAAMGAALGNIILYYQPSKNGAWRLIFWCILSSLLWVWLSAFALNHILSDAKYHQFLSQSLWIRFAFGILTLGCILLIVWVYEFVVYKSEDASRTANAQALAKEAELSKLTLQLQPHFLFNSLNSISALIGKRPEEARTMIQQLSDFLRGTLKRDNLSMTALQDELKQLSLYLDIEKVRFGHRLSTRFEIDNRCENCKLPPLILQPVLENAIKFGLYDTVGEVEIKITAQAENSYLKINIENPYDPESAGGAKGTGFGLESVERRLYLLFGRKDLLHTQQIDNQYITTILIPQNS